MDLRRLPSPLRRLPSPLKRAAAAASSLKKQQPTKGSQKEPTRGGATAWTKPNSMFKYGQPILTSAELERFGPATAALHDYYLKMCKSRGKMI